MSDLFEMLLYEAANANVDLPVLISIGGAALVHGELDSSQQISSATAPRFARMLNAALIDTREPSGETTLRVPRPPAAAAVALSGGPNRRWLLTVGATVVTGEEVSWDRWLDYNSVTNGGGWNANLVAELKHAYPLNTDERAFFHLINVEIHTLQDALPLGGPVHVPTSDVPCVGNRW